MLQTGFEQSPDMVPVAIPKDSIIYALEHDSDTFINFFMGEELEFPVPEFHKLVFSKMVSSAIPYFACAIPRGHAKTTLAKLAVVWLLLFSPFRFIIYVSNTSTLAVMACQDIIKFLESDNFKSVFGEIKFDIYQAGSGLYKFTIGNKTCILRALGAGQQVRGINVDNQRPECAVVDDLEDNENLETELSFKKLKNWWYGRFRKCFARNHKIIQIGNMIALQCLLKEHCDSKYWHSMRYGALLSNGEPLWPELWPLEKLKADMQEYLEQGEIDTWFAEMMNYPMSPDNAVIRPDEITYAPTPMPGEGEYGFITVDPAISAQTWAHKAAIWVHVFYENQWHLVDNVSDTGLDPLQMFNEIMKLAYKWHIHVVGIEAQQYQAALQPVFEYLCAMQGIEHMQFINLLHYNAKSQRIASWAAMIKKKEYVLPQGNEALTFQLLAYNPTTKQNEDDDIDCCAFGPQMIQNHIIDIMHTMPAYKYQGNLMNAYQISAV